MEGAVEELLVAGAVGTEVQVEREVTMEVLVDLEATAKTVVTLAEGRMGRAT